jgi:hypothetical protein
MDPEPMVARAPMTTGPSFMMRSSKMRLRTALIIQSRIVADRHEVEFGEVGSVDERAPPDVRAENSQKNGEIGHTAQGHEEEGDSEIFVKCRHRRRSFCRNVKGPRPFDPGVTFDPPLPGERRA